MSRIAKNVTQSVVPHSSTLGGRSVTSRDGNHRKCDACLVSGLCSHTSCRGDHRWCAVLRKCAFLAFAHRCKVFPTAPHSCNGLSACCGCVVLLPCLDSSISANRCNNYFLYLCRALRYIFCIALIAIWARVCTAFDAFASLAIEGVKPLNPLQSSAIRCKSLKLLGSRRTFCRGVKVGGYTGTANEENFTPLHEWP
jgi:hypothetical protein